MKAVEWMIFFMGPVCFSTGLFFENGSQSPAVPEFDKVAWFNSILNRIQPSELEIIAQKEEQGILRKYKLFQKIKKLASVFGPVCVNVILSWGLSSLAAKKGYKGYGRILPLSIFAGLEIPFYFAISRPCLKKIHESEIEAQDNPIIKYWRVVDQVKKAIKSDKNLKQRLCTKSDQNLDVLHSVNIDNEAIHCVDVAAYKGYPKLFSHEMKKVVSLMQTNSSKDQLPYFKSYLRRTINLLMGGEYYQLWKTLLGSLHIQNVFKLLFGIR